MVTIDHEVDRFLTLLRNRIRERDYTQLEVQDALSWGRSYISQLLTRQKSLRIEQMLLILNVIGVDPAEFFGELYGELPRYGASQTSPRRRAAIELFDSLRQQVQALTELLIERRIITTEELSEAVAAAVPESDSAG